MNLKEIYLKIEDKWFDLLDSLDEKGVPVYKAVDPLEKKGIPTLPVFIALLLAFTFLITSPMTSSPSMLKITVINQEGQPLANANITLLDSQLNQVASLQTDASGQVELNLKKGTYYSNIRAEDCDSAINEEIYFVSNMQEKEIELTCQGVSLAGNQSSFCFNPSEVGDVEVKKYHLGVEASSEDCGTDECVFSPEPGNTYIFSTPDYVSRQLTYVNLMNYLNSEECIDMDERITVPENPQPVLVEVKNSDGNLLSFATVQLVNPNDTSVALYEKMTSENGTALFKVELGTVFKVKVSGTEETLTYIDSKAYETPLGGLNVSVKVDLSASSHIKIYEKTELGKVDSKNTQVTVIDKELKQIVASKQTNSTGEVVLGVEKNKEYKLAIWKKGFNYTETELTGGEDKEITLHPVLENQVGAIRVKVMLEDEKLGGATVHLKTSDGMPTGIFAPPTRSNGYTSFSNVPAGSYCLTVSRKIGKESDCEAVTVTAGETSDVEIKLEKRKYQVTVKVTDESGSPIDEASVKLIDEKGEEVCSSTSELFEGEFTCDVKEATKIKATARYEDNGKIYSASAYLGKIEQPVEQKLVLRELTTDVKIIGIKAPDGTELNLGSDKIKAGVTGYKAIVSIGLPNYSDSKWSNVEFTINEDTGTFEFYSGQDDYFEASSTDEKASTRTFNLKASKKDYEIGNHQLEIPFRVKTINAETGEYELKISGKWEAPNGDSFNYPPGDEEEKLKVNVTAEQCEQVGDFSVCYSIQQGENWVNPVAQGSLSFETGDKINISMKITNEGSDFKGEIQVNDDYYKGSLFSEVSSIKKQGSSQNLMLGRDYQLNNYALSIEENPNTELKNGETMLLNFSLKAIKPDATQLTVKIGSGEQALPLIIITGEQDARLVIDSDIYDLSNNISFHLESVDGSKVPIGEYYGSGSCVKGLSGSDICLTSTNYQLGLISLDYENNEVTVTLTADNNLVGMNKVHFSITGTRIKDIDEYKDVESCIQDVTIYPIIAYQTVPCSIYLKTGEASRFESKNNPDSTGLAACTTETYPSSSDSQNSPYQIIFGSKCGAEIKDIKYIINPEQEDNFNPGILTDHFNEAADLYFDYTPPFSEGTVSNQDIYRQINLTITFSNGEVEKKLKLALPLTLINQDISAFNENSIFHAFKTTSLDNPDCSTNYCTLEQFFKSLTEKLNANQQIGTITVNLIGANDRINEIELKEIIQKATGADVHSGEPSEDVSTGTSLQIYVPDQLLSNSISDGKYAFSIIKKADNIYEITGVRAITQIKTGDIDKIESHLTYSKTDYTDIIDNKMKTGWKIKTEGTSLTDTKKQEINNHFKSVLRAMYEDEDNLNEDGTVSGSLTINNQGSEARNQVTLGICNTSDDSFETNKKDITTLCGKYFLYSGESADYSGIIFEETVGGKGVYFIATNETNLITLLDNYKKAIINTRIGGVTGGSSLKIYKGEACSNGEEVGSDNCDVQFESKILARAPSTIHVYCGGSITCNLDDTSDELTKALKEYGAKAIGYGEAEINLIEETNKDDADVIITTRDSDEFEALQNNFRAVEGIPTTIELPDNYTFTDIKGAKVVIAENAEDAAKVLENNGAPLQLTMQELDSALKQAISDISSSEDEDSTEAVTRTMFVNITDASCYIDLQSSLEDEKAGLKIIKGGLNKDYFGEDSFKENSENCNWVTSSDINLLPAEYLIEITNSFTDCNANKDYLIYAYPLTRKYDNLLKENGYDVSKETDLCGADIIMPTTKPTSITLAELVQKIWGVEIDENTPLPYNLGTFYITDEKLKIIDNDDPELNTGALIGLTDWYKEAAWNDEPLAKSPICNLGPGGQDEGDIGTEKGGNWEVISWNDGNEIHKTNPEILEKSYCINLWPEDNPSPAKKGDIVTIQILADWHLAQGRLNTRHKTQVRNVFISDISNVCPEGYDFKPAELGQTGGVCIKEASGSNSEKSREYVAASGTICRTSSAFNECKDASNLDVTDYNPENCGTSKEITTLTTITNYYHCPSNYICTEEANYIGGGICCPNDHPNYDPTTEQCYSES